MLVLVLVQAAFGVSVLGGAANLTIDCADALCQGQVNGKGGPSAPLRLRLFFHL